MTKISFKEIKKQKEKEFTIHCEVDKLLLELKGQWLPALATGSSSNKTLCFVGSPMIRSSKENEQLGLSFSDFAIHDPAKDRIFALEALQASNAANRANEIKPSTSMSSTSEEVTDSDDFGATTDREFTGCPSNLFLRRNSAHSACPHPLSSYSTPILLPSEFTPDKKYTPPPHPHPTTAHNGSDKFNPSITPKYLSPSTSSDFSPSKPTSLLFVCVWSFPFLSLSLPLYLPPFSFSFFLYFLLLSLPTITLVPLWYKFFPLPTVLHAPPFSLPSSLRIVSNKGGREREGEGTKREDKVQNN